VFDYRSPTVVADLTAALQGTTVAGAIAIGHGSTGPCAEILAGCEGNRFVAIASTPVSFEPLVDAPRALPRILFRIVTSTVALQLRMRRLGVRSKFIFGSTLKHNEVSRAVYQDFLPDALASGRYIAAPPPLVVGKGLESIQAAIDVQRQGVSAQKVVVTL
jgi:hypothetical protein